MPSHPRKHQLQGSLLYHVYNRSNGKKQIFSGNEDFQCFKDILTRYCETFKMMIYHWTIMSNHYHFLVELNQPEELSRIMAGINRTYTHYCQHRHKSTGFLWQGRFKAKPIQKELYFLACGRYIERNPVRAGIVTHAAEYHFSSARFYCLGIPDGLTTKNPEIAGFANENLTYPEFLDQPETELDRKFSDFSSPLGNEDFASKLVLLQGKFLPRRKGRKVAHLFHKLIIHQ